MNDSLGLFQKMLEEHANNKNLQNHLLDLIEHLYKDLEFEKNAVESLQKQFQSLMEQETFGITSKYVALKEECAAVKKQLADLRDENDDLSIQIIAKDEETKQLLSNKEHELKNFYVNQIKQKEEEITRKEEHLNIIKLNYEKKEQELYSEMQAAEVSSAIELDQVESSLRKQLNESNKKCKESMETCTILRTELMAVKEQFFEYKNMTNQRIAELQRRLREQQNFVESPKPLEKSWNIDSSPGVEKVSSFSKYQPLEVNYNNSVLEDRPVVYKKPPIFRSTGKSLLVETPKINKKNVVPPLIKLSESCDKKDKILVKKRKLFNPDDLTYLEALSKDKK